MSVSQGQVRKLTPIEMTELSKWNFVKSYQNHQAQLVNLAKVTYTTTCHVLGKRPTEKQFYKTYRKSLYWSTLYTNQIAGSKSHLPTSLYKYYARLLAKYVLEQDWNDISSVSC